PANTNAPRIVAHNRKVTGMPISVRPLTFKISLQPGIKATQSTSSLNDPLVNENSLHVGIVSQGLVGFRD
ncbi:TPA: hypothetical protein ACKFAT_000001, partial [Enterobacter hormaechei]